ncbi:MAG: hypothetical protein ACRDNZ_09520, partial [Streptosporangiaceae bacterium]
SELGLVLEVGVGGGRTEMEAEARARASLGRPAAPARTPSAPRDRTAPVIPGQVSPGQAARPVIARPAIPGPRGSSAPAEPSAVSGRGLDILARLADQLAVAGSTPVVDAEAAGRLLSVTPRTARRLLATLVDEGLAWPLPPSRSPLPGRPRQSYRLVIEKLGPSPSVPG